ncbi:hypothetical protein [Bradyrhizobium sp. LA2.1]|uniref:hypothetical protein n=1 Tax=Bradyrhizobium sp. LA2.1 TaxID=3156376 RepID=UPI003391C6EA
MQYFEAGTSSSPPASIPSIVKFGDPIWIELDGGIGRRKITVRSSASDSAGEIAVDAMGYPGAGVQQIAVPANGVASLGPVLARVIVKVSATAGYVQVSVS